MFLPVTVRMRSGAVPVKLVVEMAAHQVCSSKRTGTVDYAFGQGSGLGFKRDSGAICLPKARSHRVSIILPSGNQKPFWRAFYGFFYDRARKLGIDGTTRER